MHARLNPITTARERCGVALVNHHAGLHPRLVGAYAAQTQIGNARRNVHAFIQRPDAKFAVTSKCGPEIERHPGVDTHELRNGSADAAIW